VELLLNTMQFLLVGAGMAAMFRYVPNTHVRWGHAWIGGLFVSTGMEVAKKALALYLSKVPTYSVVYGAFATVPILLIWIYVAWVIVLLGAALTAYIPSLLAGVPRRRSVLGWQFHLALEVLQQLDAVRQQANKGLTHSQLCAQLRVDALRLERCWKP
jgi:membrane protein